MAKQRAYKKPKNMRKTMHMLLRYLGRHKLALALVSLMVIVSASANIYGTYLLKPIVNDYILPQDVPGLIHQLLFMAFMYFIGVVCTLGYTQLMVKTAQTIVMEMRKDVFHKFQTLPIGYFDARTHGELMSRFTNDMDTVQEALNNSFAMSIQSFIVTAGTILMIIYLNWQLSIIVIFAFICMFLFIRYSGAKSKHYFNYQQKYIGSLNGFIEEMVEGAKVVKVFHHEEANQQEFEQRNEELREAATKALTYSGRMVPAVVSISYLNYALSACIGGIFAIYGMIDLGSLASYLVYVRQTAMPINQFSQQVNFILSALAGAERIFEVLEEHEEIDEGRVTLTRVCEQEDGSLCECEEYTGKWAWRHPHVDGSVELVRLRGDVRFLNVSFAYEEGHPILKNINLYAKPGHKIAFVGATGAGKTTITNLINRFYEIQAGTIEYDGIDVRLIKKEDLRRSMSIVLQDTHLFTGSILENIRYGNLHASDAQVIEAAKLANADSFIRRLPNGYDTQLQGDGANLSQGQRQLLAIARAAVANPPVLILDEATSSIDTRTEALIEKGMDRLMEGRTVFVIAHRLSTVRNANAIMVLENGEIIERGDHDDLIQQKGKYYQLYTGAFELS